MLKINQIVTGTIQAFDDMQNGLLMVQRDTVFIRHVLYKEQVKVKIVKKIQNGYVGEILEIVKASLDRVSVECPIYNRCGSCHLLHMSEHVQSEQKKRYVRSLCEKAKTLQLKVHDVVAMEEPYHYRNKIIVGFSRDKNKQIQAGFYEEFTHQIIPYKACLMHPRICDEIIQSIVSFMAKFRIEPYVEDKRRGQLRHVLMRYGKNSNEIMVVFVVNNDVFPGRKNFVNALLQKHPEITTIIQNVNTRKTSVVLGDQERVLYGPGFIVDTLCDLKFRISAKSFYQINHAQTQVLYQRAIAMLHLQGNETILDAYCGIGTIGMYVSKFSKQVIGVEINKDAIQDAKNNAVLNRIKNIRFVCDDAGKFMEKAAAKRERFDVVIMDPPRSGSTEIFMRSLARLAPRQVLYISCNPQTQIRDLEILKKLGYGGKEIVPVDLFPGTMHIESVVRLSRTK